MAGGDLSGTGHGHIPVAHVVAPRRAAENLVNGPAQLLDVLEADVSTLAAADPVICRAASTTAWGALQLWRHLPVHTQAAWSRLATSADNPDAQLLATRHRPLLVYEFSDRMR